MTTRKLTLDDISDLRAYERERAAFRSHIIALKKVRRVSLGPHLTLVFENRDTIRFQIQEMARAERIMSDEGIQVELDIYNAVIPEPGTLSATLFIELVNDAELREWLPRLVGIERSILIGFGESEVRCRPEAEHEAQLTREETTAAVHYIFFDFTPADVLGWGRDPVTLRTDHPAYEHSVTLSDETVVELRSDLGV